MLSLHYQFGLLKTGRLFIQMFVQFYKKDAMEQKEKYQQLNAAYYNQEKFLDTVTRKKINKHFTDITDTITEEDIKNVKTDFGDSISITTSSAILHRKIITSQQ